MTTADGGAHEERPAGPGPDQGREARDRELFDTIAAQYARKDVLPSTRHARRWLLMRALRPILASRGGSLGTVVEIGCGTGAQALYLHGLCERFIGIDYSQAQIDIGKRMLAHLPRAELLCMNIKSEDLPTGVADLVLAVGALHHMTDLDDVIACMRRLAKPGGRLVVMEPSRTNPVVQTLRWLRTKVDRTYSSEQHYFSRPELADLLRRGGASEVRVEFQGFTSPPFAQVAFRPRWLAHGLSRLSTCAEPVCETILPGPLGGLAWDMVGYGRF